MAALSAREAVLQSGPLQPVGTVRRLVPLSAERSVRWEALSLRRQDTAISHGSALLAADDLSAVKIVAQNAISG